MNNQNVLYRGKGTDIIGINPESRAQSVWNLRQKMYAEAGVITSPSFLRIERTLDSTLSVIQFDLTDGNGATTRRPTERRLKIGDTFTVLGTCVHLGASEREDANTPSTNEQLQVMDLYTYPNETAFGVNSAGNLNGLYNGSCKLTIDSTVFIDGISMRDFYRVGTAQQGYGVGGAGNVQIARDSWDYQMYGQRELIPSIEINGGGDVSPQIIMGTSIDLSNDVATTQNNIVWWFFGFLNTGAATVQNRWLESLAKNFSKEEIPNLPLFKGVM